MVKFNFKPLLVREEGPYLAVFTVASESEEDRRHVVVVLGCNFCYPDSSYDMCVEPCRIIYDQHQVICSCKGYQFNKDCWHVKEAFNRVHSDANEAKD